MAKKKTEEVAGVRPASANKSGKIWVDFTMDELKQVGYNPDKQSGGEISQDIRKRLGVERKRVKTGFTVELKKIREIRKTDPERWEQIRALIGDVEVE